MYNSPLYIGVAVTTLALFGIIILVLALILITYTMLPILGIFLRINAFTLTSLFNSQTLSAMSLSLETATASTTICVIFGLPLAYLLARSNSKAIRLLRIATAIPLVTPPLISGALLLNIYGEDSLLGTLAQHVGLRLTQSTIGIMLAQIYVISPFVVLTASAGIEKVDMNYEYASRLLGRGSAMTFLTITIPLASKEILAGIILAWIRAIGEFGANSMMAYNPKTISIQLWEYNALGGLKLVMPGVIIVLVFSIASLAFWFWIMDIRERRKTEVTLASSSATFTGFDD